MRRYLTGCVLLLLLGAGNGFAREGFVEVTHQDLLDYPQKYWSQSIIFEDELLAAPKGQSISIGSKRYQSFKTVNLGICYAEEDLVPELQRAELTARYLFQGTVLHQPSSFFSRSPSFYIVAQKISRVVNAVGQVQEAFGSGTNNLSPNSNAVIKRVQQDLISYARKNKVPLNDLFAAGYSNQVTVLNIIYSGIAAVEQQYNTTARKLLGDFIFEVFLSEFNAPAEMAVQENSTGAAPSAGMEQPASSSIDAPAQSAAKPQSQINPEDRASSLKQRASILLKPGIRPAAQQAKPAVEPTAEPETKPTPEPATTAVPEPAPAA